MAVPRKDAETWGKRLREVPEIEANTSFFICEINLDPAKRYGWLSDSAWNWIKRNRS
jgi:hypothetical protein